jgi:hypothetical protein
LRSIGYLRQLDLALVRSFGDNMGGTGKSEKRELPKTKPGKPKKPTPAPREDDDYEDGDIATPKRDRHGEDDQPL